MVVLFQANGAGMARRVVQSGHFSYGVDLDRGTQTNLSTGRERPIRRSAIAAAVPAPTPAPAAAAVAPAPQKVASAPVAAASSSSAAAAGGAAAAPAGVVDPAAMGIQRQTQKKYTDRPSPAFPAQECLGMRVLGNDGQVYVSEANKNGVCTWKKA